MAKPVTPLLTVDCVAFDHAWRVLLIRRKHPPFQGCFALPGGFVNKGETVEQACRREFMEETGLEAGALQLVGVYSQPDRDPRDHTVTVAYSTKINSHAPKAGDDAAYAEWIANWNDQELAFDHALILANARRAMSHQ